MAINNISAETKNAIKSKSVYPMPDNPSEQGYTPSEIRHALYGPIVDDTASVISEINRIVDEVNAEIPAVFGEHAGRKDNPHEVTKAQVGLGNADNTADLDKPVSTAQGNAINNAVAAHNNARDPHRSLFSACLKKTSVVDGLTSADAAAPLSANQGRVLGGRIDDLEGTVFGLISSVDFDSVSGIITVHELNGTAYEFDLPLEYIVKSGSYDAANKKIVLVLDGGGTINIPVADLVDEYEADGQTIKLDTSSGKNVFALADGVKDKVDTAYKRSGRDWRLIADLTLLEGEAANTIVVSQDADGNAFSLDEFAMYITIPAAIEGSNNVIYCNVNSIKVGQFNGMGVASGARNIVIDGTRHGYWRLSAMSDTSFNANGSTAKSTLAHSMSTEDATNISVGLSTTTAMFPAGTTLKLYGRDSI